MNKIPSLQHLMSELARLPGVGEKTAQRFAYYILKAGKNYSQTLRASLENLELSIHTCPNCFSFTEKTPLCEICDNPQRDHSLICVVEDPFDVFKVESIGGFQGTYHVLQGSLAPLDGIGPEDLRITELVARVKGATPTVRELILVLDADLEGDTTALYLSKILASQQIRITRIAHGVPFGSDIDYIDHRTLGRAFENRVEI